MTKSSPLVQYINSVRKSTWFLKEQNLEYMPNNIFVYYCKINFIVQIVLMNLFSI